MRNEELGMRNMKIVSSFALCCLMMFAACDNNLKQVETETPVEKGYGKISVSFAGEETASRTAWPTTIFDKYVYTFAKTGETTGVVKAPDNDGFFILEIGTYTVRVQAYIGNAEPYTLAASGVSASFSVSSGSSNQVKVSLSSVAAGGKGEFSYNITYPENASAEITLQKWPGMNSITLNPVAISGGNGITQTLQLETGTYLLSVFISKNGLYAGISEAIHIYPPLATAYTKDFGNTDLLPPQTPTATDFYVANLAQSYNNIAAVTITPKSGKSSGSITVYYEGTGSTTYARSTATPTTAGTYIVTFDVTAVKVWNAASGLTAGTLTIYDYPPFTSIAEFSTWLSAQPVNSSSTPYVVALNVDYLGGHITNVLIANNTKYVSLDLSGSTITSIESSAFSDCTGLTGVTIPNSVTSIGDGAFSSCTGLTGVTIPDSVTSIGSGAFSSCTSLTAITVAEANTAYSSQDGVLYNKGKTTLIQYPAGKTGAFTIPNSVTTIGSSAFSGCIGLTGVTIPDSVTSIGWGAFGGCTGLTSVTVPFVDSRFVNIFYSTSAEPLFSLQTVIITGGNSIPDRAFEFFWGLTSITIPNSVTSIGASAFYDCRRLPSITIPDSVTSIGAGAFSRCRDLTSITIPFVGATLNGTSNTHFGYIFGASSSSSQNSSISTSLKTVIITGGSISASAFSGCTNLTGITIGSSVTSIEPSAFSGCTSLTAINVDAANTAYSSDNGVVYNKNKTTLVAYPTGKTGTFTILNSVTSIGTSAFSGCTGLTGVTIPSSVTSIGNSAFSGCTGLTSVTFQRANTTVSADSFPGDLRTKYLAGGIGTYTRSSGSNTWARPVVWTAVTNTTFGNNDHIKCIAWGNNKFVAIAENGKGAYSADGINWTAITDTKLIVGGGSDFQIAYGNNKFVVVGWNNSAYSTDGITWTSVAFRGAVAFCGIAWGNNKFVTVGHDQELAYSADGINWTTVTNTTIGYYDLINGIAWGNNKFVAIAEGKAAYSADGINWTAVTDTNVIRFGWSSGIAWGNNRFVVDGYKEIFSSADGITWTASDLGDTSGVGDIDGVKNIAWGNNKFIATAGRNGVAYSADGITWTYEGYTSFVYYTFAWGSNKFVAVGRGQIAYWDGN